jgi:CheY-like chemotaxis protein
MQTSTLDLTIMEVTIPPTTIEVALVEDRREIRESLTSLIGGTDGYKCTGSYRSMDEALAQLKYHRPHVVLCDIGLPCMSGNKASAFLKSYIPIYCSDADRLRHDERILMPFVPAPRVFAEKDTAQQIPESLKEACKQAAP